MSLCALDCMSGSTCAKYYTINVLNLPDSEQFGQDVWLNGGMLCSTKRQVHFLQSCNTGCHAVQSNKIVYSLVFI